MGKKKARYRFGRRVREARKMRGWTQTELARRARISTRYLQRIESKQPPDVTIDMIQNLAESLKVRCSDLVS